MAIAIVEELWTRIRAAIDDKIVAATNARDQAVTAKNGAVTAQTAAETAAANATTVAATVAEAKAVEEVNKLKAGAPAAFDTLLEIANELGENETERAALANSIAGKADKVHTHTSASITDAGVSLVAGYLVRREADSPNIRVSEAPIQTYHATSKYYVDGELAKKASTGAVPVTDGGYNNYDASVPATDYPSGVSYSMNNGTSYGWNAAIEADTGLTSFGSFVLVLTLRHRIYAKSTTQMVFTYNDSHKPVFIRKWYGEAWGPFRSLTDDGHQHKVTDFPLTERTNWVNSSAHPDKFVFTRPDGYLHGSMPTDAGHVANKEYVDFEVGKKADAAHTHTALQISDATATGRSVLTASSQAAARTAIGAGTSSLAIGTTASTAKAGDYQPTAANISDATTVGRNVLKATDAAAARTAIGAGTSNLALGTTSSTAAAGNHTHSQYATTTYVDGRTPDVRVVSVLPASPVAGVVYLVTG